MSSVGSSSWSTSRPGPSGLKRRRRESDSPTSFDDSSSPVQVKEEKKDDYDDDDNDQIYQRQYNANEDEKDGGHRDVTADRKQLLNIFQFASKPLPKIRSTQQPIGEFGAPAPKLPKRAHYNMHNLEDESKYVEEKRQMHNKAIPNCENSDSEEETFEDTTESPYKVRYSSSKQNVFSKYNFDKRTVNNTGLAACREKDKIIAAIEKNRVVIIDGYTGCGKTTQVPQFLIDRAVELGRPCNIVVTQPRKLAAISVARRVCEERCWQPGTVVGHQVGMEKNCGPDTLVTYMTTGVLLQKLTRIRSLKHWTHIIVDEVHERDLHTDLLLLFIKKILIDDVEGKQKHVKLILMSATLDSRKFSEYFVTQRNDFDEIGETPIIKIPSVRRFNVEEIFLDQIVSEASEIDEISANIDIDKAAILPEMYSHTVKTITNLDNLERGKSSDPRVRDGKSEIKIAERGSVLVFLPGMMEIKLMDKLLQDENRSFSRHGSGDPDPCKWDIVPLHSSITPEEQRKIFAKPRPYYRKIILSTNLAESSITVPDVVYVIDFCLTKANCVDTRTNFTSLRTVWASINQCIQRKGRTGRVGDGKVYRMVPKRFFALLDQESTPDMRRSTLEYVVLQVKTLNMGSPAEILCLALDPPDVSGIERAVANLKEVGAMRVMVTDKDNQVHYDTCDGDITFVGTIMSNLPLSPQCSRLIMLGHCFGVLDEAIIIAAGLSTKSPFSTPYDKQLESYLSKLRWAKESYSDCLAILYAYRTWQKQHADAVDYIGHRISLSREKNWGRSHYCQVSQMRDIKNLIEEINDRLKKNGIFPNPMPIRTAPNPNADGVDVPKEVALMLKIAIAGAFYPNYFHRHRPDVQNYERERSKDVAGNDLFNTVYFRNFPPGHNGKLYAKHVADYLSYGLSVPFVKIEGSKVYAIFDGSGKKIGPMCESMYRAIKKRMIRDNLEFQLLWKEDEQKEYAMAMENLTQRRYTRCPPQVKLPSVTVDRIRVVVTHIESPSQFWVTPRCHVDLLNEMGTFINSHLLHLTLPHREIIVGAFCLAQFNDGNEASFYRARIQAINQMQEALVYFVDYGNSDWVRNTKLQAFSPTMIEKRWAYGPSFRRTTEIPCLAVECRLSETKPAVMLGSVWGEVALTTFKNFTANYRELDLKIWAVDKSVIMGELIEVLPNSRPEQPRCNFNNYLKKKGWADTAPEPYTAKLNYKARQRLSLMRDDLEQIAACDEQQVAEPIDRDFLEPPRYGKTPCTLKGCFSPLELEFQSLCNSSSAKQVTVDNYSVNSVILDHEPTAPTSRLLVASTINIQDKSGRVVARETTMMPAVPGLLALMALVFAPAAELRCDVRMRRYTGVLCGLGCDPEQGEPIYMDHDMEVVFDTEIDDQDIEKINFIRNYMNVLLGNNAGANTNSVHQDLWDNMFSLLKRTRKRVDEEIWPQESYVWGRIPESSIKPAPRNIFPVKPLDIFTPHSTIHLREEDDTVLSWDFAV